MGCIVVVVAVKPSRSDPMTPASHALRGSPQQHAPLPGDRTVLSPPHSFAFLFRSAATLSLSLSLSLASFSFSLFS